MRLHVRTCRFCQHFALRVDGEKEWCRYQKGGYLDQVEKFHEVLSKTEIVCEACDRVITTRLATTAGSVT